MDSTVKNYPHSPETTTLRRILIFQFRTLCRTPARVVQEGRYLEDHGTSYSK